MATSFHSTHQRVEASVKKRTITFKAIIVGFVTAIALSILVTSADLRVHIGWIGGAHLPAATIGAFLILCLIINPLLRLLHRSLALSTSELLTVYALSLFPALLASFGLTSQLIPTLVGINYYASPENRWAEVFYPHIKPWLVPFDPSEMRLQDVTRSFYEGVRNGAPIPWLLWLRPLGAWSLFFGFFFAHLWAWAALLERQWIYHEKLTFPLVQLPMEMASEALALRERATFFKHPLMWLGFMIPTIVHSMNGLHIHVTPTIPQVPIQISVNQFFPERPWRDMGYTVLFLSFSVAGFSYLVPSEMALSFWFFFLLSRISAVVASALGMYLEGMPLLPGYAFLNYQAAGASVIIAFYTIWLMREHLKDAWRMAFGRAMDAISNDANESAPVHYRTIFITGTFSMVGMVLWCWVAGMSLGVATFMLFGVVIFCILVMTRCVSAGGLLMIQGTFRPIDLWALVRSRKALGISNLTVLAFLDTTFIRDLRGVLLPTFLDSYKIADAQGLNKRKLTVALLCTIVLASLVSYTAGLWIIYTQGGLNLSSWFLRANPRIGWQEAMRIINSTGKVETQYRLWFGLGALITFLLFTARMHWTWFPLHPLGYAMWTSWSLILYWFPFLIGWLSKGLILRYSGGIGYRRARPFFLGLALGEFAMAILWATVSAITRRTGPIIPVS